MRKIKSVSFCLNEPFENDLYDYVNKQGKFSPYIKRLIQRDMEGQTVHSTFVYEDEAIESDINSFI